MRLRVRMGAVKEMPLGIESRLISLDHDLSMNANVLNGLGICGLDPGPDATVPLPGIAGPKIHSCDLSSGAVVRRLSIPNVERMRVHQKMLFLSPRLRETAVGIPPGTMRTTRLLQEDPPGIRKFEKLVLGEPLVRTHAQISEFPHRRRSADVEWFSDSERRSFLREAEILKGIPSERAELVAIFRHVPIEVISQLRFMSDTNEIQYRIPDEPRRTQTRVHDMAVIRDAGGKEIHLVPHRTKCRVVPLA